MGVEKAPRFSNRDRPQGDQGLRRELPKLLGSDLPPSVDVSCVVQFVRLLEGLHTDAMEAAASLLGLPIDRTRRAKYWSARRAALKQGFPSDWRDRWRQERRELKLLERRQADWKAVHRARPALIRAFREMIEATGEPWSAFWHGVIKARIPSPHRPREGATWATVRKLKFLFEEVLRPRVYPRQEGERWYLISYRDCVSARRRYLGRGPGAEKRARAAAEAINQAPAEERWHWQRPVPWATMAKLLNAAEGTRRWTATRLRTGWAKRRNDFTKWVVDDESGERKRDELNVEAYLSSACRCLARWAMNDPSQAGLAFLLSRILWKLDGLDSEGGIARQVALKERVERAESTETSVSRGAAE